MLWMVASWHHGLIVSFKMEVSCKKYTYSLKISYAKPKLNFVMANFKELGLISSFFLEYQTRFSNQIL